MEQFSKCECSGAFRYTKWVCFAPARWDGAARRSNLEHSGTFWDMRGRAERSVVFEFIAI
jgi:hypothetical protein